MKPLIAVIAHAEPNRFKIPASSIRPQLFPLPIPLPLKKQGKKPILVICRGIQVVNVVLGGTLFQDIPSPFNTPVLKHIQDTISFDVDHPAELTKGVPI